MGQANAVAFTEVAPIFCGFSPILAMEPLWEPGGSLTVFLVVGD